MIYLNTIQNINKIFVVIFATIVAISCSSPAAKFADQLSNDNAEYKNLVSENKEQKMLEEADKVQRFLKLVLDDNYSTKYNKARKCFFYKEFLNNNYDEIVRNPFSEWLLKQFDEKLNYDTDYDEHDDKFGIIQDDFIANVCKKDKNRHKKRNRKKKKHGSL